jgi:hypothetical protein
MFFLLVLVVLVAIVIATFSALIYRSREREAREAFEATLTPKERQRLEGFSSIKSWRDYFTLHNAERGAADSGKRHASHIAKLRNESHTEPHI